MRKIYHRPKRTTQKSSQIAKGSAFGKGACFALSSDLHENASFFPKTFSISPGEN